MRRKGSLDCEDNEKSVIEAVPNAGLSRVSDQDVLELGLFFALLLLDGLLLLILLQIKHHISHGCGCFAVDFSTKAASKG